MITCQWLPCYDDDLKVQGKQLTRTLIRLAIASIWSFRLSGSKYSFSGFGMFLQVHSHVERYSIALESQPLRATMISAIMNWLNGTEIRSDRL